MKKLNHLAIIMDGNNRWAKENGLPSREGHKEGVKKARLAVEYALEKKINYLTLFAFSTENWLRDELEVKDLINLFFQALEEQTPEKLKDIMTKDESYSVLENSFSDLESFINQKVLS